jgi:hypothetical protein
VQEDDLIVSSLIIIFVQIFLWRGKRGDKLEKLIGNNKRKYIIRIFRDIAIILILN